MSVGVVTVAVGDTYQAFMPRWAEAVAGLERPPDEVTIVVDRIGDELADEIQGILPDATFLYSRLTWEHHPQVLVNDAIRFTQTEWICRMDADDRIYPHALNPLDDVAEHIFGFGLRTSGGQELPAREVTAEGVLRSRANLMHAGSPFRRSVWEASSGYQDLMYEDWVFWREAAAHGFTFGRSGTIDYEYVLGDHNVTRRVHHATEAAKVFTYVH
ncbi:MAG TPA: glycosyltransferase family A protein [Acidimicrobiia bacterium]